MVDSGGGEFEDLVFEIYKVLYEKFPSASLSNNVIIDGPDGKRQIDVLIDVEIGDVKYLTIIECKDYKRRVNVTV